MSPISKSRIHMVGIAGAGMSGIAKVLIEKGITVSGSDLQSNEVTRYLEDIGVIFFPGHDASNLQEGVDLVVVSTAIPSDNPEVVMARQKNIPVIKRGQMLADLVNERDGIAVAGAHGKTTTTAMIYTVLEGCNQDPALIVGGELQGTHLNACLGKGDLFIVEADESDASFLAIHPYIAVITNIEDDHLDFYKTFERIQQAFTQFVEGIKPHGFAVLCGDYSEVRDVVKDTSIRHVFYGEHRDNLYRINNWRSKGIGSVFEVIVGGELLGEISLSVPGKHNAINALAAIAVGMEIGLEFETIKNALVKFRGAKRRFELIGDCQQRIIVDDYAHHPTEIRATIDAARTIHEGRLVVVFQPHRYTRTRQMGEQLGVALEHADLAIITKVYAAGEKPIPGIDSQLVYGAARNNGCQAVYIEEAADVVKYLGQNSRDNDLIVTMGAGDVWRIGVEFLEILKNSIPQN